MPAFASAYRSYRRDGLTGLCRLVRERLTPQSYELYRFDLSSPIPARRAPDGIRIEVGDMERLRAWVRSQTGDVPTPYSHPPRDPALEFCWALSGEEAVGIIWMGVVSPLIRLASGEAITKDSYTAPQWRGRGVGKAVKVAACRHLKARGFAIVYTTVRTDNLASRRVQEAVGFSHIGCFTSSLFTRRPATAAWR